MLKRKRHLKLNKYQQSCHAMTNTLMKAVFRRTTRRIQSLEPYPHKGILLQLFLWTIFIERHSKYSDRYSNKGRQRDRQVNISICVCVPAVMKLFSWLTSLPPPLLFISCWSKYIGFISLHFKKRFMLCSLTKIWEYPICLVYYSFSHRVSVYISEALMAV